MRMHQSKTQSLWQLLLLGALGGCLTGANALAQGEVPADPPPVGSPGVVPEKIEPQRPIGEPGQGETLSEELQRTRGVIKPTPGLDPGLVQPPPDGGAATTPVIPPPPTVQPQ
jgi:hypothetical protein